MKTWHNISQELLDDMLAQPMPYRDQAGLLRVAVKLGLIKDLAIECEILKEMDDAAQDT